MWEQPKTKFLKLSGNGLEGREVVYGRRWVGVDWGVENVVMEDVGERVNVIT